MFDHITPESAGVRGEGIVRFLDDMKAKRLHMHRNTVMYKVKQVQELCGLDLEDPHLCERLLFSCQLARYYEKMNANKSPQILETN